ncbi:unnamed protein product [Orchesella dallaii]|uniref:Peptidase S1 domain-containing protein n=1 Tax=Orchesella dallaii TaxID=48710 RepID=A0ABP1QCY2_9HEXA
MKAQRFIIQSLLFHCCVSLCLATVWKTEDAYIIDDSLNDDEPAVTEVPNACTVSDGRQGRCVPVQECNPFYNFFSTETRDSQLEILQGFQEYLNASESEPCVPDSQDEIPTTNNPVGIEAKKQVEYVCCTSLKFAKAQSISLDEYLSKNPDEPSEKPSQIPFATVNTTVPKIVSGSPASPGEFPFAPGEVRHQDAQVSKLFLHPGFFRTKGYFRDDVALVKLKTPVSPAGNVRAIALHGGTPNIDQGLVETVVAGWGKTCAGSCRQSTVLLKTKIKVTTNSECSRRYSGTQAPPITQNMVCASGTSNADACNGDSGGPLFIYQGGAVQQIGIVSWGTVWKTEDAYIIDDIIDDPKEIIGKVVTQDSTNVCVDSTGAQGRCVPIEECSPFYNFFSNENETLHNHLKNLQGLQRHLNSTEEQCTPGLDEVPTTTEEIPSTNRPNHVCCTSIKYANVRTVSSLDEYLLQSPNKPSKDPIPQIPHAVHNSSAGLQPDTYIVSGSVANIGEFPYITSDVALLKLEKPIYGYSHVKTVSLHTGVPNINQGGVQAEVAGWGKTCASNSCPQSSTLLKTTLQVISNAQCTRMLQGTAAPQITQKMVCAWDSSGRDACFGDSGGPLVVRDNYGQTYQIGIVSFGIGCGQYPGIYTRVSSYVNWINKHKNRG